MRERAGRPARLGRATSGLLLLLGLAVCGCRSEATPTAAYPWPTLTPRLPGALEAYAAATLTPGGPPVASRFTPTPTPTPLPTVLPEEPYGVPPPAASAPDRLRIEAIGLDVPVVSIGWQPLGEEGDGAWEDPGASAGWLETSAMPGHGSNVVIVGHHNARGEVFRTLVDVAVGDHVEVYAGGNVYRYQVRERFIIPEKGASEEERAQNALWIAPTYDERVTLMTCWPYTDNTHRLMVIAKPALPGGEVTGTLLPTDDTGGA